MNDLMALMEQRLAALSPLHLQIRDDSAQHAGHPGARLGGSHYHLYITSPQFSGLSRVARHRLVYQTLGDLMQNHIIHALAIDALAPDES